MKKTKYILFLLIIFHSVIIKVDATSGRLKSNSIKTCNGVTYGQHSSDNHWHVASRNSDGTYSAIGSAIYSDPCKSSSKPSSSKPSSSNPPSSSNTTNNNDTSNSNTNNQDSNNTSSNDDNKENDIIDNKSSDNTLKTITIDGKNIEISDNINYSTTNKTVNIEVTTNDKLATYIIKNNDELLIGENIIVIEVTAEDGTIKIYNVNITREKILSSQTGINIIINDEEVKFDNYKTTIYVTSTTDSITFDYTLIDKNAKIEMNEIPTLKTGDNIIKIKVIAEDGTEQEYEIIIHKYSKKDDNTSNTITLGILGLAGYGIYNLINKKKAKQE